MSQMSSKVIKVQINDWIEQTRPKDGLTIDDLLHSLRKQSQRYSLDKNGDVNNPGNEVIRISKTYIAIGSTPDNY